MKADRITRVNELLRREIAEGLFTIVNEPGFDLAEVSITHVIASPDLRTARVMVSVRAAPERRERALNHLRRHRAEFQSRINKDLLLKYTPRLSFHLDTSIEKGDHILGLLGQLDVETEAAADGGAEAPGPDPEGHDAENEEAP